MSKVFSPKSVTQILTYTMKLILHNHVNNRIINALLSKSCYVHDIHTYAVNCVNKLSPKNLFSILQLSISPSFPSFIFGGHMHFNSYWRNKASLRLSHKIKQMRFSRHGQVNLSVASCLFLDHRKCR